MVEATAVAANRSVWRSQNGHPRYLKDCTLAAPRTSKLSRRLRLRTQITRPELSSPFTRQAR